MRRALKPRRPVNRPAAVRAGQREALLRAQVETLQKLTATLDEQLERERKAREALERRVGRLERELARGRAPRRVPCVTAARRLGLSPASIRRLIEAGDLRGAALRLPDRERRAWVVDLPDLERFERESGATGAAGTPNRPDAGQRAPSAKG